MTQYHDNPYIELVNDVLNNGVRKENRTGTDTFAVFSRQMRFDLRDGTIPLLTTKKMHTRSVIYELLWYLRGDTNIKYLNDNNVRIWNEWSSPEGHLNNVYGAQWRRWEDANWLSSVTEVRLKLEAGTNLPFEPEIPTHEYTLDTSDDIVGMQELNSVGDLFTVLGKVSPAGAKNSRFLVRFNDTGSLVECNRPNLRRGQVRDPYKKTVFSEGCLGVYKEKPKYYTAAYNLWYNMMRRCYDKSLPEYYLYGGAGTFVDQDWRCFANFMRDLHELPWFNAWKENPSAYDLDKDYYGSKCYSKQTCLFLPSEYNRVLPKLDGSKYIATNLETNDKYEFTVQRWFARNVGIKHSQAISTALQSSGNTNGWHFERIRPRPGYAFRQRMFVDQINDVVQKLRHNPNDRRLIVSAWNVGYLDAMALPPCHYSFQFYTRPLRREERMYHDGHLMLDGTHEIFDNQGIPKYELSCMLNQRSCDVGLGVPFNIVQYSILLHMIAQVVGMVPGEFIWNGGDVHIYENHRDALAEQICREPYPAPTLELNPNIKEIDDYTYDDFKIVGYEHHPLLKMEVSV